MPNHIHGILGIDKVEKNSREISDSGKDNACIVPTAEDQTQFSPGQKRFQNQGFQTLSSIIGSYKSAVSKHAHRLGYEFSWQGRFHDHIIRTKSSYQRIKSYIKENPSRWESDMFHG